MSAIYNSVCRAVERWSPLVSGEVIDKTKQVAYLAYKHLGAVTTVVTSAYILPPFLAVDPWIGFPTFFGTFLVLYPLEGMTFDAAIEHNDLDFVRNMCESGYVLPSANDFDDVLHTQINYGTNEKIALYLIDHLIDQKDPVFLKKISLYIFISIRHNKLSVTKKIIDYLTTINKPDLIGLGLSSCAYSMQHWHNITQDKIQEFIKFCVQNHRYDVLVLLEQSLDEHNIDDGQIRTTLQKAKKRLQMCAFLT